jgi:hypothetical protein
MTMYAIPLSALAAEKKAFNASMPPAEAPTPTIGKGHRAREKKSTGAAGSSAAPEGVAAGRSSGSMVMQEHPVEAGASADGQEPNRRFQQVVYADASTAIVTLVRTLAGEHRADSPPWRHASCATIAHAVNVACRKVRWPCAHREEPAVFHFGARRARATMSLTVACDEPDRPVCITSRGMRRQRKDFIGNAAQLLSA